MNAATSKIWNCSSAFSTILDDKVLNAHVALLKHTFHTEESS